MKTPIILITSEKWGSETCVVFDDENISDLILDSWIDDAYRAASENDDEITREQVAEQMEEDFLADNTDVDAFWPDHQVLRTGNDYYQYTDTGTCSWIRDLSSLPIAAKLDIIIEDRDGRPGQGMGGSCLSIARELRERINEINELVVVGNPACSSPTVYTADEISDELMWEDGLPDGDEYDGAEDWIDENLPA